MKNQFNELLISSVERLTDDAVAIGFAVPDDLAKAYEFQPGQYLTLRTQINGEDIRRSYSICAGSGDGLRVGIKKVPEGRFSSFAQSLCEGEALEIMPPQGRFTCSPEKSGNRDILLIAAGSGITPVLSIAISVLEGEPDSRVTLIYGNQAAKTIMFREEIEDLKDRFLERFHVYHVLSRESQDVAMLQGRIDVARIEDMTEKEVIQPDQADEIYLCGPSEMTNSLVEHFKSSGVDEKRLHTELFESPDDDTPVKISKKVQEAIDQGVNVEVIMDGLHKKFVISDPSQTVLQAAESSGLDLPFSCAGGMCATCRCRIVEGNGEMDRNYSLDDWETEAGFVLACQLRPTSEALKLDFDAA